MYRGRIQLGKEIWLGVLCHDGSRIPTAPLAAPEMEVWSSTEKLVSKPIPTLDRYYQRGFFAYGLLLNSAFSVGQYRVVYRWTTQNSYEGLEVDTFEIIAGGNDAGNILSMTYFAKPQANFVVTFLDSGKIQKRRNPTL